MLNPSHIHTLSFYLNLDDIRPNRDICSDEQFEVFCTAFAHVKNKDRSKDTMPLHAIIRLNLETFQKGHMSFDELCECLKDTAESGYLFADNRLHRGKLTHIWRPVHHGNHKWLTDLVLHCHGMHPFPPERKNDFLLDAHVFLSIPSKERPKFIETWVNYIVEEAETWLIEMVEPLPVVKIIRGIQPNRTSIRVDHPVPSDALFQLSIHDDVNNVFGMELEWDTGTGQPMLDYAIHERISEAYRHDESVYKFNINQPIVYTLDIDYPDRMITA